MRGAIIVNGFYENKAYTHQVTRIQQEFHLRGMSLKIIKNDKVFMSDIDLSLDFAIFLDKDKYLARILEQKGVIVFNNSFALEHCDDKILTLISLHKNKKIVLPKTIIAPIKYEPSADIKFLNHIESKLNYPLIAKRAVGSLGDGVRLIENNNELREIEEQWSIVPHLYQEYIAQSRGKSFRVYVVGHKAVASMFLENKEDFRSNAEGSKAVKIELNDSYINMAQEASKQLELDFCAVDFCTETALILEVNSNAFFEKMESVTAINIAGFIADYIINFLGEIN